ncbi:MAG TPA: fused MFS/spermidine synthase [Thermoanaerobaculia bacterium]|nr:fused MFS/spermidine synthase [Thermoanaerobaculia bacterium]
MSRARRLCCWLLGAGSGPRSAVLALPYGAYFVLLSGLCAIVYQVAWLRQLRLIFGVSTAANAAAVGIFMAGLGVGGLWLGPRADRSKHPLRLYGTLEVAIAAAAALTPLLVLAARSLYFAAGGTPALGAVGGALVQILLSILVLGPATVLMGGTLPAIARAVERDADVGRRATAMLYGVNTLGAVLGALLATFVWMEMLGTRRLIWGAAVLNLLVGLAAHSRAGRLERHSAESERARRLGAGRPGADPVAGSPRALAAGLPGAGRAALLGLALPPRPFDAGRAATAAGATALACALLLLPGPGPAWRHGGIGGGRMAISFDSENSVRRAFRRISSSLAWEAEGRESSVALFDDDGYAFYVNGMSDGNARGDAPTAVMAGLLGAALHPDPRTALVIGLGTGSTAGWLAAVPGIERVDVFELEPEVVEVARVAADANHDVLDDPKVELHFGDGRELLLTSNRRYDVIYSNPSNPYRAGVASFFSRDFYREAAQRLDEGGIFVQWLQGYEVDADVVRTAYATLSMVFPYVETWRSHTSDIQLVATLERPVHDLDRLERLLEQEPWSVAMPAVWGVSGLEGLLSAYVGSPTLTRGLVGANPEAVNTDDHPLIEFGFARNSGVRGRFQIRELREAARGWDAIRPETRGRDVDWELVEELAEARLVAFRWRPDSAEDATSPAGLRTEARRAFVDRRYQDAAAFWASQPEPPRCRIDRLVALTGLAIDGTMDPAGEILELAREQPIEALVLRAFSALAAVTPRGRSTAWPTPTSPIATTRGPTAPSSSTPSRPPRGSRRSSPSSAGGCGTRSSSHSRPMSSITSACARASGWRARSTSSGSVSRPIGSSSRTRPGRPSCSRAGRSATRRPATSERPAPAWSSWSTAWRSRRRCCGSGAGSGGGASG